MEANPAFNTNNGLQTLALYLDNFKGHIDVYGTLQNSPSGSGNNNELYALLTSINLSTKTNGVRYVNVSGNFTNIKIKFIPDGDAQGQNWYGVGYPGNPTPGVANWPNGKLDKVLLRS
jgi:hypothetical protein